MNNTPPRHDDGLFHFQLDLPDRKKTDSSSPDNNIPTKRNSKEIPPQPHEKQRTGATKKRTSQLEQFSRKHRRTNSGKHPHPSTSKMKRNPKPSISNIKECGTWSQKVLFLQSFIVYYVKTIYRWFQKELTVEKLQKKERKKAGFNIFTGVGTTLFFPAVIFYMELIFHIYMGLGIKYIPIYLFFSIAAGLFCSLMTNYLPEAVNRVLSCVLTFVLGLLFCIEMVCKTVLAQYFQLASSASMAVNNHLTDYTGAIIKGIFINIIGIFFMLLPFILFVTILKKRIRFAQKPPALALLVFIGVIVFHILGLISLHLPYGEDQKPAQLYKTDTDIEEQVRQLGVLTMLRLDVKHSIFGVDRDLSIDTEELEKINSLQENVDASDDSLASPDKSGKESSDITASVIDTSPNMLDLDFEALSESTSDESVQWLNEYFSSLTPTDKNEYTGMFKGYNVIFITAEGFSGYMIDPQLTPTLYKLTHEGFGFNNFYTALHYTSTSNGECQNLLGLYPKGGEPRTMGVVGTYPLDVPFTLAKQLNNLGYTSIGYHFNGDMYSRRLSHPQLGYEWNDSDQLELEVNEYGNNIWPQSDNYMITETFDLYVDKEPFNIYYMTISGHMPYSDGGNSMADRNYDEVADLPYSEDTKCYLAANLELEKGLTTLLEKLEEAGIADHTLLVMAADHIPYFDLPVLEELTGKTFGDSEDAKRIYEADLDFDVYKNSLIIWSASMETPVIVDKVCCQVDILPTVSNLLGLNYDSRLLEGSDILSDSEGLVVFSSKSWKSDLGLYNSYTEEFTPASGVDMSEQEIENYVETMKTAVNYKLQATTLIQETNYYGLILPDGVPVSEEDTAVLSTDDTSTESDTSSVIPTT